LAYIEVYHPMPSYRIPGAHPFPSIPSSQEA